MFAPKLKPVVAAVDAGAAVPKPPKPVLAVDVCAPAPNPKPVGALEAGAPKPVVVALVLAAGAPNPPVVPPKLKAPAYD